MPPALLMFEEKFSLKRFDLLRLVTINTHHVTTDSDLIARLNVQPTETIFFEQK